MHPGDKRILTQAMLLRNGITTKMENFQFGLAAEQLYEFTWHEFADHYIEKSKERLEQNDHMTLSVLFSVYKTCLTILNPFMPFITEEILSQLSPEEKSPLITSPWPATE